MAAMTQSPARQIIDDFAAEIQKRKFLGAKPATEVINFRTDLRDNRERPIYRVPIELLRFRKDNGRISSDVADYIKNIGPLGETSEDDQKIIGQFLYEKDPEKTSILRQSIIHTSQQKPAIITCDGFLIDGNRRKLVMEQLHEEFPDNQDYSFMKVVILPGKDDEGGPPTLLEIEKLENRYQLQSDGKSEYFGFDRALSIKRKIKVGLTLRDQLMDDPQYAGADDTALEKAEKETYKKYLRPLECADRYLKQFNREGQYRTVSKGMSDPSGRWQAFIDYSDIYTTNFENPKKRVELGIDEDEIGAIEEAAFDIIRLRHIPDMPKVHTIMRNLPKYCSNEEGKKQVIKIAEDVSPLLTPAESQDKDGRYLSVDEADAKWASKNQQVIIYRLKKASTTHEIQKERETPLELLEAAYKKLTHQDMVPDSVTASDCHRARDMAAKVQERAHELEQEFYRMDKNYKKLLGRAGADA